MDFEIPDDQCDLISIIIDIAYIVRIPHRVTRTKCSKRTLRSRPPLLWDFHSTCSPASWSHGWNKQIQSSNVQSRCRVE
jgi:hypothetical protein